MIWEKQVSILRAWYLEHAPHESTGCGFQAGIRKITAGTCGSALVEVNSRIPQDAQVVSLQGSAMDGVYIVNPTGPACFQVANCFPSGRHADNTVLYDAQQGGEAKCFIDPQKNSPDFLLHVKQGEVQVPHHIEPQIWSFDVQNPQQLPKGISPPDHGSGYPGHTSVVSHVLFPKKQDRSQGETELSTQVDNSSVNFLDGQGVGQPLQFENGLPRIEQPATMSHHGVYLNTTQARLNIPASTCSEQMYYNRVRYTTSEVKGEKLVIHLQMQQKTCLIQRLFCGYSHVVHSAELICPELVHL